jgi:hypothetical protein
MTALNYVNLQLSKYIMTSAYIKLIHISVHTYLDVLMYSISSWSVTKSGWCGTSLQVRKSHHPVAAVRR